jgi:hypothetical protein
VKQKLLERNNRLFYIDLKGVNPRLIQEYNAASKVKIEEPFLSLDPVPLFNDHNIWPI